jgi:hypothetical protein
VVVDVVGGREVVVDAVGVCVVVKVVVVEHFLSLPPPWLWSQSLSAFAAASRTSRFNASTIFWSGTPVGTPFAAGSKVSTSATSADRASRDPPPWKGKRAKNFTNDRMAGDAGAGRSDTLSTRSSRAVAHAATPRTTRATTAARAAKDVQLRLTFAPPAIGKKDNRIRRGTCACETCRTIKSNLMARS